MKKNKHRIILPLVFLRIILCCSCLILLNCNSKTNFERNIDFESGWQKVSDTSNDENTTTFTKEFEVDIQNDKVYLLRISSPENLLKLQLNKAIVSGIRDKSKAIDFNITEQLRVKNILELTFKNAADFEAKIHCVNKLFIREVDLNFNETSALIEVKVKNAFSIEKQGILEYTLYSGENKKLDKKETPVFISGNAENLYHQEFRINRNEKNFKRLKIVCQLYSDGKLFDINTDNFNTSKHASTVNID